MNRTMIYVAIAAAALMVGGCDRPNTPSSAEPKKDTIAPAPVRPGDPYGPAVPGPGPDNPKK
jgi:PBP1b-binding outer membrane lipoprotein LpoB